MKFLETIRFENGSYHLLDLHQARLEGVFKKFFPSTTPPDLTEIIPEIYKAGKHKVRVEYDSEGYKVTSEPYLPREIGSVKLMESSMDYSFKFSDRMEINQLVEASEADEIIIVKDGLITDSSYANLAFFDGARWWTPTRPLLKGVRRTELIKSNKIHEKNIKPEALGAFQKLCLINAMLDLGDLVLGTEKIRD